MVSCIIVLFVTIAPLGRSQHIKRKRQATQDE